MRLAIASFKLDLEVVHLRAADEARHEQVLRRAINLGRRADLHDLAGIEHHNPVSQRHRLGLIMGDIDRGTFELLVQPRDLGSGLNAQLSVEIAQRLIEQKRFGAADDRPADRHALCPGGAAQRRDCHKPSCRDKARSSGRPSQCRDPWAGHC